MTSDTGIFLPYRFSTDQFRYIKFNRPQHKAPENNYRVYGVYYHVRRPRGWLLVGTLRADKPMGTYPYQISSSSVQIQRGSPAGGGGGPRGPLFLIFSQEKLWYLPELVF